MGVGACKAGTQTCKPDGAGWSGCFGQVTPSPETCDSGIDDDCDGAGINESGAGCTCPPNALVDCYTGPAGTENVGACHAGKALCNDLGTALGACLGEITPTESVPEPDRRRLRRPSQRDDRVRLYLGDVTACYTGPAASLGLGACHGGQRSCLGE